MSLKDKFKGKNGKKAEVEAPKVEKKQEKKAAAPAPVKESAPVVEKKEPKEKCQHCGRFTQNDAVELKHADHSVSKHCPVCFSEWVTRHSRHLPALVMSAD